MSTEEMKNLAETMRLLEDKIIDIGRLFTYQGTYDSYSFDMPGMVQVRFDEGRCGDTDIVTYSFPAEWLALDMEEVKPLASAKAQADAKALKEYMEAQEIERKRKSEEAIEKAERTNYERLRAKYEQQ